MSMCQCAVCCVRRCVSVPCVVSVDVSVCRVVSVDVPVCRVVSVDVSVCRVLCLLQEFSQTDYDELISGWNNKVHRCALGDQKWGLFYAEKPTAASHK